MVRFPRFRGGVDPARSHGPGERDTIVAHEVAGPQTRTSHHERAVAGRGWLRSAPAKTPWRSLRPTTGTGPMNADKHRFRELILHDLVQDYDDRLFARLYREVFSPSFRENELESADDMRLQIRDRTGIQLIVAVDRTDVPVAAITA